MTHLNALRSAGLFGVNAPRYTSYPTATQFSANISAAEQAQWLAKLPGDEPVSLYVHVPFCERLCWYCACRTQGVRSLSPVQAYTETLLREIDLVAPHLPAGLRASRLHFGGGTPTILPPEDIARLVSALRGAVPLALDGEFSVEIDPTALDAPRLDAFAQAGMGRASIGVQDFSEIVQQAIGRIQSYAITIQVVDDLRSAGIRSLNIDLVYGLPHQNWAALHETLQQTLSLAPDRLALFGYAHVPWMAKRQKMIPESALPGPEERFDLASRAAEFLCENGYVQIGIDHFARPDDGLAKAAVARTLRRNFQGYTDDQAASLLGFGASSISRLPGGFVQNAPITARYNEAIAAGRLAGARGIALGLEDRVRARAIEMLMCDFTLSLNQLGAVLGDFAQVLLKDVEAAARRFNEFTVFDGETLAIPPVGRPLTRLIAQMFDSYAVDQSRHSSAV